MTRVSQFLMPRSSTRRALLRHSVGCLAAALLAVCALRGATAQTALPTVEARLREASAGEAASSDLLTDSPVQPVVQTSSQTSSQSTAPATAAAALPPPTALRSPIASGTPSETLPFSVSFLSRNRADAVDFYSAPPYTNTYPYVEHLLRIAIAQRKGKFDWLAEISEATVFDVPNTSISNVAAQGQLFLGGNYYAANGPANTTPSAAFFKQGWLRYHGAGPDTTARLGRFEFFEGAETAPRDSTLLWLQTNRIAQRLIGNFGFSNAQRSFDGADAHFGKGTWDITGMAGRATKGVFDMNGNEELNVDVQYLAYTKRQFHDHLLFRTFAIDYHDGRTGLTKTDNRTAAARALDHRNIRIGTYGADAIASIPAGPGNLDALFWGVLQNGQWGLLSQHSGAFAVEGGYRFTHVYSRPWIRGGAFRSTGDNNNTDTVHNTFFQILPTPRLYARFPFYNAENNKDQYAQLIDNPSKRMELRADLHFLQLTAPTDFWYQGGGAYDTKAFCYVGRPGNNHGSFASIPDISMDFAVTPALNVNTYYAHSFGKTVIGTIYPTGRQANYGYLELIYKFGIKQRPTTAAH